MKLLDAVCTISSEDLSCFAGINNAIQDRLFWLEMREPDSDGVVYDSWEEKHDEFEEIAELSREIFENLGNNDFDFEDEIEDLQEKIEDFQLTYGGLSRLKVNIKNTND